MSRENPAPMFKGGNQENQRELQNAINKAIEKNPKPLSESQRDAIDEIQKNKTEEHFLNIISKAPEEYSVEDIVESYEDKEKELDNKLHNLKNYITAKENIGKLEYEIHQNDFLKQKNSGMSHEVREEKMLAINKYKQIIKSFEGSEDPNEVFEHAKKSLRKFEKVGEMTKEMSKNAKDYPFLN